MFSVKLIELFLSQSKDEVDWSRRVQRGNFDYFEF
jgi:hypothetical protein